jgi:hypothetical protein
MHTDAVTFQKLASAIRNRDERPMVKRKRPKISVAKILSLGLLASKSPTAAHALIDAGEMEARGYFNRQVKKEFY